MYKLIGTALLGVCLTTGLLSRPVAAYAGKARSSTDRLIIQFEAGDTRNLQTIERNQVLPGVRLPDGRGVRFLRHFEGDAVVVQLPGEVTLDQAQRICAQMITGQGLASVVPDKRFYRSLNPSDPEYLGVQTPGQWHLYETTAGIRMPAAWDQTTGSSAIVVAVVDTGIVPHRDLSPGRLLPGYDFISSPFTANDGDGRDSDPTDPGDWADVGDPCYMNDPLEDNSSWHGLSVAGVIAATANNSLDIAGMDFAAQLLPVRVLGKCGGSLSDVADAVRWAAGLPVAGVPNNPNPARVINLSLSGDGACSAPEQSAINAAVAAGAVVVVAAGNEAGNVGAVSPANCDNVIAVGAIGRNGAIASYTNFGLAVDLVAPGGDNLDGVLTLSNLGTTTAGSDALVTIAGTSFTTAQASAVASLMLALNPSLTPDLLGNVMKATTRTFPHASCDNSLCGTGVLDAAAALTTAMNPGAVAVDAAPTANAGGPYSGVDATAIAFDGSLSFDPENAPLVYSWDFGDDSFGTGVSPTHTYAAAGTYIVTLVVNDGVLDSAPATAVVDVSASGNQAVNIDSGGGGGCVAGSSGRAAFDPVWWLMLLLAGVYRVNCRGTGQID